MVAPALLRPAGLIAAALATAPVLAAFREEQFDLPVQVADAQGKALDHTIKVTVFSDERNAQPAPVLVLNHGRAADADGRAALGRARFVEASRFFVQRGFIVAVPTRVGYGISGGQDVEHSGSCNRKNYPAGHAAAAAQTLAVLQAMRARPDAAPDRAVVVGQSYGGATAVTVAALNPPGVQASINFAGGAGGNPRTMPMSPCAPAQLRHMFRSYGESARIPSLWLYAENDMYFGPRLPREWFNAYVEAGAKAEFIQFPPLGEDGHQLFGRFPRVWQPRVAEFLDAQGFPAPASRRP